jgi:Ni,Fe-hydrogenase I cytochrome b subunit
VKVARSALRIPLALGEMAGVRETVMAAATYILRGGADAMAVGMKFSTPQPLYCEGGKLQPIYVYQAPVRIWHWLHAFSFLVLAVTGYLIAHPLPSPLGEASAHMAFGRVIPLMGGSAGARSWHLFGMWMMVVWLMGLTV